MQTEIDRVVESLDVSTPKNPPRRDFSGIIYLTWQQVTNAIRATNINELLNKGYTVWGDDGPDEKGNEYDIDECIQPCADGIRCLTKEGNEITIFAYRSERKTVISPARNEP